MHIATNFIIASLFALATNAVPTTHHGLSQCNPTHDHLILPGGQHELSVPYDAKPVFVTIGVGVQNYTCSDAGTYVSAGAVAELWDISCIYKSHFFAKIQDKAIDHYDHHHGKPLTIEGIPHMFPSLGDHFFSTTPGNPSAISPVFDFSSSHKGNNKFFILGKKTGSIPSPDGPKNVDWLELGHVEGDLAKYVFRTDTKGGQPPAKCHPGSHPISVKYAAKYWFFK